MCMLQEEWVWQYSSMSNGCVIELVWDDVKKPLGIRSNSDTMCVQVIVLGEPWFQSDR